MNSETIVDAIKNKPVVSSLCLAFAPAVSVLGPDVMNYNAAIAACTAMTAVGAINLVRHKSVLSKAFSAAAVAAGGVSTAALLDGMNFPGWGEFAGYIVGAVGASAAGAANVASHFTRDVGAKIGVVKPNDPSA